MTNVLATLAIVALLALALALVALILHLVDKHREDQ